MISKKNRFIGKREIERLYKTARPVRLGAFTVRLGRGDIKGYRLAVVVSKKVSKSAVVRNRIRRRIFEHVRKEAQSGLDLSGRKIIITVFEESIATIPHDKLVEQLERLFKKAGI